MSKFYIHSFIRLTSAPVAVYIPAVGQVTLSRCACSVLLYAAGQMAEAI